MTGQPDKGAVFSGCGAYRYHLWRRVQMRIGPRAGTRVAVVMLNPSTADAELDDPTIRRCIGFARRWGFEWLDVLNIFALRSTDPTRLYEDLAPTGPDNDRRLVAVGSGAELVVCAWGAHGSLNGRGRAVAAMLRVSGIKLHHLKLNGDGSPGHPLYLKGDLQPTEWAP
jgi:hypothetical protein